MILLRQNIQDLIETSFSIQHSISLHVPILNVSKAILSGEEENELIALKSRLWKLGFDRNNPESTFNKHKDIIPIGSADVAAFLSKYPGNLVD